MFRPTSKRKLLFEMAVKPIHRRPLVLHILQQLPENHHLNLKEQSFEQKPVLTLNNFQELPLESEIKLLRLTSL